jgi:hypothetical protein
VAEKSDEILNIPAPPIKNDVIPLSNRVNVEPAQLGSFADDALDQHGQIVLRICAIVSEFVNTYSAQPLQFAPVQISDHLQVLRPELELFQANDLLDQWRLEKKPEQLRSCVNLDREVFQAAKIVAAQSGDEI